MDKKTGFHFYVNIKNLDEIIKAEEKKDVDLKRTLHRLQTYFLGFSKLIHKFNGKVEKYTSGRAHIVYEDNDTVSGDTVLEIIVACFIYNNDIFNGLSKYNNYFKFQVHSGADYGSYYDYLINDTDESIEYTTIGGVANNSAKIQSYAPKNYIYVTDKFIKELSKELQEKFVELTAEEKTEFSNKIRNSKVYKAEYTEIFSKDKLEKITENLDSIKRKIEEESNGLNIKDISFEGATKKISFDLLSLKGKNKKLDFCGVLCADIRGFTKLFNINDANLDGLKEVMASIYRIMGETVSGCNGVKVQYQGDRIVAIYNNFTGQEEDLEVRLIKSGLNLIDKIEKLNSDEEIKKKLNNRKISIGVGCGVNKVIATRLGLNGNKDNIILSKAYYEANRAEDYYAEEGQLVINKNLKECIDKKERHSDNEIYQVLKDIFLSIGKSGYYFTNTTIDELNKMVKEREAENVVNKLFSGNSINNSLGENVSTCVKPWSNNHNV